MKNKLLWSAIFALVGTQVHADLTQPVTPPTQAPTVGQNTPPTPKPQGQNLPSMHAAPAPIPGMNCEYKIPAETKTIDQSVVINWSEKAVAQAFNFDANNLDNQLQKLQSCFTEQGWTGFNTALQKSGNLEAIKTQKLTVSSQVEGEVVVTEAKDNQWKINLPLQVVYQNEKEKVTQLLSIDLTVGRKITGDLGITQMIAAPRATVTQQKTSDVQNNSTNSTTGTQSPSTEAQPAATPSVPTTPTQPTAPDNQSTATPSPTAPEQPTSVGNPSTPTNPATNEQPTSSNDQSTTASPAAPVGQPTSPQDGLNQPSPPASAP